MFRRDIANRKYVPFCERQVAIAANNGRCQLLLFTHMGFAYRIGNQQALHFVTATVEQWVDVFTRPAYMEILLDSLRHCQR